MIHASTQKSCRFYYTSVPHSNYFASPTFTNNLKLSDNDRSPNGEVHERIPSDVPDHEEIARSESHEALRGADSTHRLVSAFSLRVLSLSAFAW